MTRSVKTIAFAAILVVALGGCYFFPRRQAASDRATVSSSGDVVRGASTAAPTVNELGSRYGCDAAQVDENWRKQAFSIAPPGTPLCRVLGRYGQPVSVTTSSIADMQLLSMLHRQANGRYYSATFVYYADTKVNRQLKRPIGRWVVERVTVTR
jgi:hypothetical protein